MSDEPSPRPWHAANFINGIEDANNGKVAANIRDADAALIVDAVNHIEETKKLSIKLYDPIRRAETERDRMRDALNEVCHRVSVALNCPRHETEAIDLLVHDLLGIEECARAAIGEDAP